MPIRIALFRFHKAEDIDDIHRRVNFFKILNPNVKIFGLFGGRQTDFKKISHALRNLFEDLYFWKEDNDDLKWKSSDVAYQLWYTEVGAHLNFDFLHSIEWDLIFMQNLDELYKKLPNNSLSCTGLSVLKKIESTWFWTRDIEKRKEWLKVLHNVIEKYSYNQTPYAILGACIVLPKAFLEGLVSFKIPNLSNDELRIPLFAQILGFSLVDNSLFDWNHRENNCFNCDKIEVEFLTIQNELKKRDGYRVFHPFIDKFNHEKFIKYIK